MLTDNYGAKFGLEAYTGSARTFYVGGNPAWSDVESNMAELDDVEADKLQRDFGRQGLNIRLHCLKNDVRDRTSPMEDRKSRAFNHPGGIGAKEIRADLRATGEVK